MNKFFKTSLCGLVSVALAAMPMNVFATTAQEETVYVKLQPNGAVSHSSVSKHLLNSSASRSVSDATILREIQNLNGFESYTINGDQIIWQTEGKDIYYKGKTDKTLPVSVEITYKLNGEIKTLAEMLGEAGKVEIHFHYRNASKVGNLYTPFVVAMSTTLPSSVRNINITNGKTISNGRGFAVMALAAPGLYDSLQVQELKSLDDIILTYETDDFVLNDVYNIVTPKLLEQSDLKIFDEVNKFSSDAQKLANSSKELVKGSDSLRDGVKELRDSIVKAQSQLQNTGKLLSAENLDGISNTAANAARKQVAAQQDKIRAQIHHQLTNMGELEQVQSQLANQLAQAKALELCLSSQTSRLITPLVPVEPDVSNDTPRDITSAEASVIATCQKPEVLQQYIEKVKPAVAQEVAKNFDLTTVEEKMFQSTYASLAQVAAETASTTARNVASQIAATIQKGFSKQLDVMMSTMIAGVDQLLDGAAKLSAGMARFDQEGIQTLSNVVNNKLKNTSDKAKRLVQLAQDYNNFSGINQNSDGEVKFILMIDAKKKQ